MCDLFALSSTRSYSAPKSLPLFAVRGGRNMDGWGIGYFAKQKAFVEKSANRVYFAGQLHDSFQRLARVVSSRIIISHVRFRTSGPIDECHAHPFILQLGGHDWIFAHNGKAPSIEPYQSPGPRIDCAVSDSARVFEYVRDRLTASGAGSPGSPSLFEALLQGTRELLEEYPGNYNYLLTNGSVLFAFSNHRQFMLLKGSRTLEGGLLLTTVAQGLSEEGWKMVSRPTDKQGILMAIMGTDIVMEKTLG